MKPPAELEGALSFGFVFFSRSNLLWRDEQKQNDRGIINESARLIYTWLEYEMRLFMRRSPGV